MIRAVGGYGLKRDTAAAVRLLEECLQEGGDDKDAEMLSLIQRKQGIFGQKEQARPKIRW